MATRERSVSRTLFLPAISLFSAFQMAPSFFSLSSSFFSYVGPISFPFSLSIPVHTQMYIFARKTGNVCVSLSLSPVSFVFFSCCCCCSCCSVYSPKLWPTNWDPDGFLFSRSLSRAWAAGSHRWLPSAGHMQDWDSIKLLLLHLARFSLSLRLTGFATTTATTRSPRTISWLQRNYIALSISFSLFLSFFYTLLPPLPYAMGCTRSGWLSLSLVLSLPLGIPSPRVGCMVVALPFLFFFFPLHPPRLCLFSALLLCLWSIAFSTVLGTFSLSHTHTKQFLKLFSFSFFFVLPFVSLTFCRTPRTPLLEWTGSG